MIFFMFSCPFKFMYDFFFCGVIYYLTFLFNNLYIRCDILKPDEAAVRYLLAVHSIDYVRDIESIARKTQRQRDALAAKHTEDIYYCEGSSRAAFLAAGGSIKVMYFSYASNAPFNIMLP